MSDNFNWAASSEEEITDEMLVEYRRHRRALRWRFFWGFILGILLTLGIGYWNASYLANLLGIGDLGGHTVLVSKTTGQVGLTADELLAEIRKAGVTAYWTGPVSGYKYALTISASKQVFIRYLPNESALADTAKRYRVVATYPVVGAYDITQQAGQQSGAVSASNSDGAVIYYSQASPLNVYLAYPNADYEIEVFDPAAGQALSLATTAGEVRLAR